MTPVDGGATAAAHHEGCDGEVAVELAHATAPPVRAWVGVATYPEGCEAPDAPAAIVLLTEELLGLCAWRTGAEPECAPMLAEGDTSAITAVGLPHQDWQDARLAVQLDLTQDRATAKEIAGEFGEVLDQTGLGDLAEVSDAAQGLQMLDQALDQMVGGGSPRLQSVLGSVASVGGTISVLAAAVDAAGNVAAQMNAADTYSDLAEAAPTPEWELVAQIEAGRAAALAMLEACIPLHTRARTMTDVQIWVACSAGPAGYLVSSALEFAQAHQAAVAADAAASAT